MSRTATTPVTPRDIHEGVVEALDALNDVVVGAFSCARNLEGDVGPVEGERRLRRLSTALSAFADGCIPVDPFTPPAGPGVTTIEVTGYTLIEGTSVHDGILRFIAAVHDTFRVGRRWVDPVSGNTLYAGEYTNARYLPPDEDGTVRWASGGRYEYPLYSAQEWGADLWDRLFPILAGHAIRLFGRGFFARARTRLRGDYSAACNRLPPLPPSPPSSPPPPPADGKKPDQEQTSALVADWFARHIDEVRDHPNVVTQRRIAVETNTHRPYVGKSPMWVKFADRRRKEASTTVRTVPLSDQILAVTAAPVELPEELEELVESEGSEGGTPTDVGGDREAE